MANDFDSVLTVLNSAGLNTLCLVKSSTQSQLCSAGGVGCGADGVELGALSREDDFGEVADCHAAVLRSFLHAGKLDIGDRLGVYGYLNGNGAAKALCHCAVGTCGVQVGFSSRSFLRRLRCAACGQAQNHGKRKDYCEKLLHWYTPFYLIGRIILPVNIPH